MKFTVHSTFRNSRGAKALPHGLEWDLDGESFTAYVAMPTMTTENKEDHPNENTDQQPFMLEDTPNVRRAIVEAHNRWCFAKDIPFRTVNDIDELILPKSKVVAETIIPDDTSTCTSIHYYVKWKESLFAPKITESKLQLASEVLKADPSATGDKAPVEVWINVTLTSQTSSPSVLTGNTPEKGKHTMSHHRQQKILLSIGSFSGNTTKRNTLTKRTLLFVDPAALKSA